ncbi:FecR domain-containing protein [Variovorax sp. E3]|uniref:FecR domain-containing protein n=1 Tax=Variovorax sp. E3 TaxID=1914993 RepID=UPI0018DE2E95|nr:FecR family protein [Variovorax sp. E3]
MTNAVAPGELLEEAADWMVRLQSGEMTAQSLRQLEQWRTRSTAHAEAWKRAEAVMGTFEIVPKAIGRQTMQRLAKPGRRQAMRALGVAALAAPVAWLAWRDPAVGTWLAGWNADLRTAAGEQKTITLADGTRLVLNTSSAVDVAFTGTERRLRLRHGEILLTTSHDDPSPVERPFIVQTAQGTVRALGTRFSVGTQDEGTRVTLFEGGVRIQPEQAEQSLVLRPGEQALFSATAIEPPHTASPTAALWEQGMLVASDMRLDEFAAELGRYRAGVLRCHPGVASLRVSGAFPLKDTDASLQLLQKTLPVRISTMTRYWVAIEPR